MVWRIAFWLYVPVATMAGLAAVATASSMLLFLTAPLIQILGAPWGVAFLRIVDYMLRNVPGQGGQLGTITLVLGAPLLGMLVNAWLLWLQLRRSTPPDATQGAEAAPSPLSAGHKIWWAIAVAGALFLCFSYVMNLWDETRGRRILYDLNIYRAIPLAQAIVLVNCWVLFVDWRRWGALALAALALPLLVAVQTSYILLPEWSWTLLAPVWTVLHYVMYPGYLASNSPWGFWLWLPVLVLVCIAGLKLPAFVRSRWRSGVE